MSAHTIGGPRARWAHPTKRPTLQSCVFQAAGLDRSAGMIARRRGKRKQHFTGTGSPVGPASLLFTAKWPDYNG